MKKCLLIIMVLCFATVVYADVYVRGYTRSDGTYVAPHYRSDPDGNPHNNWSTRGNFNPYTGKEGTRDPGFFYTPNPYQGQYRVNNNPWN